MKLSILIVDDEATARRRLKRLLMATPQVEIVAECATGAAAVATLRERAVDVVFLDVRMPEMDGFGVLRALSPDRMPLVVFVTAFDEFAMRAFEAHAIDYLLKPFGEERVRQAIERVRTFVAGMGDRQAHRERMRQLLQSNAAPAAASCLFIKRDDRVVVLTPGEIDWIEALGDYMKVHVGTETHLTRATLGEMQQRLATSGFVRVHRSRLVNLARVREFRSSVRGESTVVLKSGTKLKASHALLKAMQQQSEMGL